jgi:hypothetical protein
MIGTDNEERPADLTIEILAKESRACPIHCLGETSNGVALPEATVVLPSSLSEPVGRALGYFPQDQRQEQEYEGDREQDSERRQDGR